MRTILNIHYTTHTQQCLNLQIKVITLLNITCEYFGTLQKHLKTLLMIQCLV